MKIRWLFTTSLIIAFSFPLAILPHRLALKVGEILGLLVFYIWQDRRKIAIENIKKTYANKLTPLAVSNRTIAVSIARETFKNLGRSFAEIIKIYWGYGKGIIDNVEIRGIDNYLNAKSKNKGVIFITGHCGNWELMALVFGVKVDNVSVVARTQDNIYLNRLIENVRARYGNNVIYKKGALKGMMRELKKNRGIGILMDQAVLKDEGYKIDFLGRPAWTSKMPALMARKTGAAVIPIFINRLDEPNAHKHVINIYPEVILSEKEDVEKALIEDTKRFSEFIEDYIEQHPSEWLWIHRRWKRA
ncbi:lipid A biosynthesis acyltransferase [Dissulfurispira thermophila]|uniref:Lipid A biosynthesis acyltransferase n=2 Tax=root TaxID=1 RepID=A0A7G1H5H2_9BACT|nr:lysophospholipid acyltransferase family protein [Dissulfurispira thermophila]BCB96977.1 lipid A biosynthesis acyltransferase [Dissulfurispira thermophila]